MPTQRAEAMSITPRRAHKDTWIDPASDSSRTGPGAWSLCVATTAFLGDLKANKQRGACRPRRVNRGNVVHTRPANDRE